MAGEGVLAGGTGTIEAGRSNPFSRRTVMIMFAVGFLAFVALLYALGAGNALRDTRNGGAHGASNSLVGFSALAGLLRETGSDVRFSRSENSASVEGVLIITPNPGTDPQKLARVVERRRYTGPTVIILPKWGTSAASPLKPEWVQLGSAAQSYSGAIILSEIVDVQMRVDGLDQPEGFAIDGVTVDAPVAPDDEAANQTPPVKPAQDIRKKRPVVTIDGDQLIDVVFNQTAGGAQIALVHDNGFYPEIDPDAVANEADNDTEIDYDLYPVVIVADADLANNLGMADKARAKAFYTMLTGLTDEGYREFTFDLMFNGLGSSENLLTVAFRPPFLSATICLLLAALGLAWIAFNRFGPPLRETRAIDFGKAALVENTAGLLRRLRRDNVMANAYADLIRERAAKSLGLPAHTPPSEIAQRMDNLHHARRDENEANERAGFTALSDDLRSVQDRSDLSTKAAALARWKKEMFG